MPKTKYGYDLDERPHVAAIDFAGFYSPAFSSHAEAGEFYESVRALPPEHNRPKLLIHQAARMVWLADRLEEVAAARPALQVLFYLIAAEAVAKIYSDFKGKFQSREHVRLFFEKICSDEHRARLTSAFRGPAYSTLTIREVADILYDVRCNVAHEGMYYTFSLRTEGVDGL